MNLQELRKKVNQLLQDYQHYERRVEEEKKLLETSKEDAHAYEQSQSLVQRVAQALQQKAHEKVASVVSRCLEAVYEEEGYGFEIEFERKRGKTEANLSFTKGGEKMDPLEETAGGVVEVAAFALRLACLVLSKPKRRLFLALDEPFRMVSEEYQPRLRELIETLAEELELQLFIITHDKDLVMGKVIRLT